MAVTIRKYTLSNSVNGRPVKVAATSTPGTTIHQALSGSSMDEIWLWAMNTDTSDHKLTIEFGGTSVPDDLYELTVPAEGGLVLVVPGLILSDGLIVSAFAASASVLTISGYVNRITQT